MNVAISLALGLSTLVPVAALAPPSDRTVHVTVLDDRREPVPDLTAADLVVKEGGKEREIVKVERASAPLRVALAVEERMTADSSVRMALFEFMKRVSGAAEISLITVGLRNTVIVDYTKSLDALVGGINGFSLNPSPESSVAEGVLDLANRFITSKPARPAIVLIALSGVRGGVDPHHVLERLGQSGATMNVITLASPLGAPASSETSRGEQVIGDGARQSGGRRIDVTQTAGMPKALLQVAEELLAQYAVTYTLPDGVKPDRRVNVSLKRRGVQLRAPSIVPDK
jgi:hypothetical protein